MKTVTLSKKEIFEKNVVVLGNFDGVHVGHRTLIEKAGEYASFFDANVACWTFEKHPLCFLSGNQVGIITPNEEKNSLFEKYGANIVFYENFETVKDLSPEKFVEEILIKKCNCVFALCGFNFRFGKNGDGNADTLCRIMEKNGLGAYVLPPVKRNGKEVCSTDIRAYLEKGDLQKAEELLGRPYSICENVISGKKLGRKIGLPTVNQEYGENRVRLAKGVYFSKCEIDDKVFFGVSNVGCRPTVNGDKKNVNCETHLIGFDGDLYGKKLRIDFIKKLRDEKKFASLDELKIQIEHDIEKAKSFFNQNK